MEGESSVAPFMSEADLAKRPVMPRMTPPSTEVRCRELAAQASAEFGTKLPATKKFELYLIRGISNARGQDIVLYQPEFMFLLDVGFEALVGVVVPWRTRGSGDPSFPEFTAAKLRSPVSRDARSLIYPILAGSIMIGVKTGTPDDEVRKGLETMGLKDIDVSPGLTTARCNPFFERSICSKIEAGLHFVKYAEPNRIVRLIDFSPGWFAEQIM